jgi:hypothetical protein
VNLKTTPRHKWMSSTNSPSAGSKTIGGTLKSQKLRGKLGTLELKVNSE